MKIICNMQNVLRMRMENDSFLLVLYISLVIIDTYTAMTLCGLIQTILFSSFSTLHHMSQLVQKCTAFAFMLQDYSNVSLSVCEDNLLYCLKVFSQTTIESQNITGALVSLLTHRTIENYEMVVCVCAMGDHQEDCPLLREAA